MGLCQLWAIVERLFTSVASSMIQPQNSINLLIQCRPKQAAVSTVQKEESEEEEDEDESEEEEEEEKPKPVPRR